MVTIALVPKFAVTKDKAFADMECPTPDALGAAPTVVVVATQGGTCLQCAGITASQQGRQLSPRQMVHQMPLSRQRCQH